MVKFTGTFQSTLEFGQVIIISGSIKKSAENFTMNFLSENVAIDIPFHMNFVFGEHCQIIRNTKINGEFGTAENMPGMFTKEKNPLRSGEIDKNYVTFHPSIKYFISPCCVIRKSLFECLFFDAGEKFILYVLIGLDRFHISINNIHFCDYIFRSSVKRIVSCQVRDFPTSSKFDTTFLHFSSFTTWKKSVNLITEEFSRFHFQLIKHDLWWTCRFPMMYLRHSVKATSLFWKEVPVETPTDLSRWNSSSIKLKTRVFTWTWGFP